MGRTPIKNGKASSSKNNLEMSTNRKKKPGKTNI
jgi:hypothetical protein